MAPETSGHLPAVHGRILGWIDEGLDHGEIAARLDVEPAAVAPLVEVARRKRAALDAVARHPDPVGPDPVGPGPLE